MSSLHDVYQGLDDEEECHKTEYVLQFLWRDITSNFDVIGPYFTLPGSIEAQQLYSYVMKSMLALNQYGFIICALLCDGASCNLAVLKQLCNHKKGDELNSPFFISRFNGQKVHLIICPSHQVKQTIIF
jgi:hypothetical protein